MYSTLLTEIRDNILIITVNRPDKMNALNKFVFDDLYNVMDEVYNNENIKSAIITGAGEKAFVAGADISEFLDLDKESGTRLASKGNMVVFSKIENSPKPVIAAVNGFALGGGCELAMACHFRIASEKAKFGQPEVNLGLIPGYGATQRLPQLIGKGKAMELLMTADLINAQEALNLGLVNYVVPAEELMNKAVEILIKIHTKAPLAIEKMIACVNEGARNAADGHKNESERFGMLCETEDMKEGAKAFLEKRKPIFKGK